MKRFERVFYILETIIVLVTAGLLFSVIGALSAVGLAKTVILGTGSLVLGLIASALNIALLIAQKSK